MRLALLLPLVAVVALAGCAPTDQTAEQPAPTATRSSTPSATPSAEPTPEPTSSPIGLSCSQLVSDQVIYNWGSGNFALDDSYTPAAGSAAASAVAAGGVACRWINLTSAETVDVAVAAPGSAALETERASAAAAGSAAPELSGGYFRMEGSAGRVDVFTATLWVTASSVWFGSSADAAPLVESALAAV